MFFPQKSQEIPKFTIFQLENVLVYLIESEFHVRLNEIFGKKSGVYNVVIVAKFRFTEVNIHNPAGMRHLNQVSVERDISKKTCFLRHLKYILKRTSFLRHL